MHGQAIYLDTIVSMNIVFLPFRFFLFARAPRKFCDMKPQSIIAVESTLELFDLDRSDEEGTGGYSRSVWVWDFAQMGQVGGSDSVNEQVLPTPLILSRAAFFFSCPHYLYPWTLFKFCEVGTREEIHGLRLVHTVFCFGKVEIDCLPTENTIARISVALLAHLVN